MCRGYVNLIRDAELVERLAGLAHDLQIGIASHHDGNLWLGHVLSLVQRTGKGTTSSRAVTTPKGRSASAAGGIAFGPDPTCLKKNPEVMIPSGAKAPLFSCACAAPFGSLRSLRAG